MDFGTFTGGLQVADAACNLPGMVTVVINLIRNIKGNENLARNLLNLAIQLSNSLPPDVMRGAPTDSSLHPTYKVLESVIEDLRSIIEGMHGNHGFLRKVFTTQDIHSKLEQVKRKLENLVTQVVVLNTAPTICNTNVELPSSQAGLDRATSVLEFLGSSQGQDFRVIAIHGQPGVGKTTLLKSIWKTVSTEKHFHAKAFVQIGHNVTYRSICDSQSSICRQLGATNKEFPSHDFGREELSEHFKKLKTQGKPLFLAIDNVFNKQDLESLLPSKVGRANLPTSSCIALTCRNYRIVEGLIGICGLQKSNHSQVFKFEPQCLGDEESREVFVECAGMDHSGSAHKELLDALVPLCGGLPLALTVLGRVFSDEAKRENEQWRDIQDQWRSFNDLDDEDSAPVIKAVRLSFEMLKSHQQAFLEMVSTFYGWRWDHVESLVGVKVMTALKNSALVWKVEHVGMCNQGALREGRQLVDELGIAEWFPYGGVVSMHDLTLRFGERTIGDFSQKKPLVIPRTASGNDLSDVSKLRHLIISNQPLRFYDEGFVQSLQNAKCLQSLVLCRFRRYSWEQTGCEGPLIRATYCDKIADLHSLNLYGLNSSQRIMRMVQVSRLRVLILWGCSDLVQLPDNTPLDHLEYLRIRNCPLFQGFSASCLRAWRRLKVLELMECPRITTLPPELGASVIITSLTRLNLYECNNLMELPHQIGGLCSLKELELYACEKLGRLPDSLGSLTSLERLALEGCESLIELPQQTGELCSLKELKLFGCEKLERLPDSLGSLTSLGYLGLGGCESLIELPQHIGGLCSLKYLRLSDCKKLERLPDSLGSLTSLERLALEGCESLIELPQHTGELCSLKELRLSGCKKLERLLDSLGILTSLEDLILKELRLSGCKKLERLPDSLGSLTSLEYLALDGCESLIELPQQTGELCSLKKLWLSGCKKLARLPDSLGSLTSLEVLDLGGCESLIELPQQIGELCSLKKLELKDCKKLERLPDFVGGLTSLEQLEL